MKKYFILIIMIFISIFTIYSCSNAKQMNYNAENNEFADDESIETDTVYKNKESGNMLVANSDSSFILYMDNKNPVTAVGGIWSNKNFLINFEYVECSDPKYVFIRKGNNTIQESFTFNKDEWESDMDRSPSPKELYEDKINIAGTTDFPVEYTVADYGCSNEEILSNSVLQYGESSLGATYDSIFIFSEDNTFIYYCSGFGSTTKEEAEDSKKRIKYLCGKYKVDNNQIFLEIDESEIKSGGHVEYDVISMFKLVDYEITHELDNTTFVVNFKIHIDNINPRYESYIEIDGEKYFFMSGYKLYRDKEKLDLFIKNFNY